MPPTSRCGRSRASSACTYGRVTSSVPSFVHVSKRRNSRQTSRAWIGARSAGRSRSVTVQPLSRTSQWMKAATASGWLSASDGFVGRPRQIFGLRHRQRHDRGLARLGRPHRRQRHVVRLHGDGIAGHPRRERGVDGVLDLGHGAEAAAQRHARRPVAPELLAHRLVDADVGAAEPVDRLLGVADDEQLARRGPDGAPVGLVRIVRREQQQDLGLQRIGVLELVDEQVREPLLERRAHVAAVAHDVARAHEQVEEVERADASLGVFVGGDDGRQLVVQARGEVGVGVAVELLDARGLSASCASSTCWRVTPLANGAVRRPPIRGSMNFHQSRLTSCASSPS